MPKVLRILNRLSIGGPLLNAAYLTKYMPSEFETLLIAGGSEDHEKDAGFVTNQFGIHPVLIPEMGRSINPRNDYAAYLKIKKIIKEFKPDIIHTHAAKPGTLGRFAARSMKVPVIIHTYHGHVFHSYFNLFKTNLIIRAERQLAKWTDAIIVISEQQFRELAFDFKIASSEKFKIIPLGLDLEKFHSDSAIKRAKFRKEFDISDEVIVITIIGRLVAVKNHVLFLEAFVQAFKKTSKKIKAFIVGDGDMRTTLELKAKKLGICFSTEKDSIHDSPLVFTSWRNDVDVINAGSDIIALTSFNEGTPVSLIEAQAANKPVLSTKVGGIQDIVLENETALLSDSGNVNEFSKNLLRLIEDDELRKQLGEKGANFVMKRFSYQRLVKDMENLYIDLLEKKTNVF